MLKPEIVGDASDPATAHLAVVVEFYQAIHRLDPTGVLDTLAPDFIGHVSQGFPGGLGGRYRGAQAMMDRVWLPVMATFAALPHPERIYHAGVDTVIAIGDYRGVVPSTGRSMTAAFAHIIQVVDGTITELRQITDTNQWAAGLHDPAPND